MTMDVAQPILIRFFLGFVLAVAIVPLCRFIAGKTGAVAHPRNDRWHRHTIPLLGGVAIAVATLVGGTATGLPQDMPVLCATAFVIFLVGLVDDLRHLKPFTKLIAQIALASTLVYFNYSLGWLDSRLLDDMLTIVWVVGLTNAFNLLDNMDGLCAGTALIVSLTLIVGFLTGATRDSAGPQIGFLAILAGSVAGFLVYNFPPASIFMGDSGALLLGFSLAALTLGNQGVRGSRSDVLSVIAGPVFVLLIPIFDTTLVTVSRLFAGRSPAIGGRDHSSHRLVAIGLSERSAVFVLWSLAAIGGGIGLTVRSATQGWSVLVGGLFGIFMCLFALYLARVRVYDEVAAAPAGAENVTPIPDELLHKQRVFEVLLDFGLISIAYYWANDWYFDPEAYLRNAETFYASMPIVVASQLVAFFGIGIYRGSWHLFRAADVALMAAAVILAAVAAHLVMLVVYGGSAVTAVMVIHTAILLGLMVLSRAAVRLIAHLIP
jgi:UDP-GlcNAc:undecaprenyl-phosphate GlcNAc-1-phosphate transferase